MRLIPGFVLSFSLCLSFVRNCAASGIDDISTKETARLVDFDTLVRETIYPRRDHDFFSVLTPSAGLIRIRHAGLAPNVASAVKVHSERGTLLRWRNGNPGQDHIVSCAVARAGRYWIEIADTKDTNYSKKPYSLELSFQAVIDHNEPNDSTRSAVMVNPPVTINGFIFPPADQDVFSFIAPEAGCIYLLLTGVKPDLGSQIKITGESLTVMKWRKNRKLGHQKLLVNVNRGGLYSVLLKAFKPGLSLNEYRLRIEFYAKSLDANEPNDSRKTATLVLPGESIQGYILPGRDRDVYKIPIRGVGRLIVRQFDIRDRPGAAINIIDPFGVSLSDGWRRLRGHPGEQQVEVPIEGWGTYFIEIGTPDGRFASIEPYKLQTMFLNRSKALPFHARDTCPAANRQ